MLSSPAPHLNFLVDDNIHKERVSSVLEKDLKRKLSLRGGVRIANADAAISWQGYVGE